MKKNIFIASFMIVSIGYAQDSTWQNGSGDFTDTTHWDTALVPGVNDNTIFGDGSYTVSFTRDETNRLATFTSTDSGDLAFALNGNTWTLTNGLTYASGALNNKVTIDNGTLIAGGSGVKLSCFNDVLPSYLTLGADSDSEINGFTLDNSHMIINGGTHLVNEQSYFPSGYTTGSKISSLTVSNGTFVMRNHLWCGGGNSSTGIINVAGGSMIVSNYFSIGDHLSTAVGIVNITGGDLSTYHANWLGNAYGATGILNLYGGTFTCKNTFEAGHRVRAKGYINISGGKFTANSNMYLANYESNNGDTTGIVAVTGGELVVKGGLDIARWTNCYGRISFDGNCTSSLSSVKVGYGPGGYGEFYLTNGVVTLSADTEIATLTDSEGFVTIDGGMFSNRTSSVVVGRYGRGKMVINNGDVYANSTMYAGRYSGASGEIEVNGGYLICDYFNIGSSAGATGTYTQVGGTVKTRSGDITIGESSGAYGVFTVNGGTLNVAGEIYSGHDGTGIMNIQDGVVNINNGFYVGNHNGSDGSFNITGGAVTNSGTIYIGNESGSSGSVTIGGNGLYSSASPYIGRYGTGNLTLLDGDTALLATIHVGTYAGSTGTIEIAGGTFTNRSDALIGEAGVGTLNISGGTNYFTSLLNIGSTREGNLNISGGETIFTGNNLKSATGTGCKSRINVSGGHLSVVSSPTASGYLDIGGAGECIMEMTGGLVETEILRIAPGGGATPPVSQLIMNGGRLNVLNGQYLADTSTATAQVHLVNGVLSVKQLRGWHGHLEAFFDGGTLEARQSDGNYIYTNNGDGTPIYHILTARGLVIDSNGFNVGTPLSLPDAPGEHGKLTKKGLGRFTIYGTTSFTGPIAIEEGEVDLGSSGMVTLAGGVQIDGAGLLDLHARDQDFTMGADSESRVDGTVELASGRELIFPSTSSLYGTGTLERVTMQSGSTLIKNKTTGETTLKITNLTIDTGANIELTGYTESEFKEGITFVSGTNLDLATESDLNFTLNGTPYDWVAVTTTSDGSGAYTFSARYYNPGTVIVIQ